MFSLSFFLFRSPSFFIYPFDINTFSLFIFCIPFLIPLFSYNNFFFFNRTNVAIFIIFLILFFSIFIYLLSLCSSCSYLICIYFICNYPFSLLPLFYLYLGLLYLPFSLLFLFLLLFLNSPTLTLYFSLLFPSSVSVFRTVTPHG